MAHDRGNPVHGAIHQLALGTAVVVPFFRAGIATGGGASAITLDSNHRLVITDICVISNTAADIHVFLSEANDTTPETGETVLRGMLTPGIPMEMNWIETHREGAPGADLRVSSSASSTVDVMFTGYIIKV